MIYIYISYYDYHYIYICIYIYISTIFPCVKSPDNTYHQKVRWPKRAMRCSCPRRPISPWTPCGPAVCATQSRDGVDGLMMNSGDIFEALNKGLISLMGLKLLR